MNESSNIAEAATQPLFLCPICLRKMHKAIGFDPLERYRQMLWVIKQLHSAVLEASPGDDKDNKGTGNENEGETLGITVQIGVEAVSINLENDNVNDAEISEAQNPLSDRIVHNITDAGSDGQSNVNGLSVVDEKYTTSSHSERFEDAIVWLEKVVSSLAQFEDQWVEQRAGHRTKSKVV